MCEITFHWSEVNNLPVKFPAFNIFLSSVFQYAAAQRNLKWKFNHNDVVNCGTLCGRVFCFLTYLIFFQNWFLPFNIIWFKFHNRVPGDWFSLPFSFTSTLWGMCLANKFWTSWKLSGNFGKQINIFLKHKIWDILAFRCGYALSLTLTWSCGYVGTLIIEVLKLFKWELIFIYWYNVILWGSDMMHSCYCPVLPTVASDV